MMGLAAAIQAKSESAAMDGIVDTLDDALNMIKEAVTEEKLRTLPPGPCPKSPPLSP